MLVARTIGVAIGLAASFLTMCYATFVILLTTHENPGDSAFRTSMGVILVSLPFWIASWIVYLCFSTDAMPVREILGCRVRPRALLWTFLAEVGVFATMVIGYAVMMSRLGT